MYVKIKVFLKNFKEFYRFFLTKKNPLIENFYFSKIKFSDKNLDFDILSHKFFLFHHQSKTLFLKKG